MDPRDAFKFGFMARCVELGLDGEDTSQLAKQAEDLLVKEGAAGLGSAALSILSGLGSAAGSGIQTVGRVISDNALPALAITAATPPTVGALAAYLKNRATDTDTVETGEVKQQELADTYRRAADRLRRANQAREAKRDQGNQRQIYL